MKRKLMVMASLILAVSAIGIIAWPRSIKLIGSDSLDPSRLNVSILRGSTWDNSISEEDGIARFGRGPWKMPLTSAKKIVAVYDEDTIYWEGVVEPDWIGTISLKLNEGRPKNANQEAEQGVHGNTH